MSRQVMLTILIAAAAVFITLALTSVPVKGVRTVQRFHESNLAVTVMTDGMHRFLIIDNGNDVEVREF